MESKIESITKVQQEQELEILKTKMENDTLKKRIAYLEFRLSKSNYINSNFTEKHLKNEISTLKTSIKKLQ